MSRGDEGAVPEGVEVGEPVNEEVREARKQLRTDVEDLKKLGERARVVAVILGSCMVALGGGALTMRDTVMLTSARVVGVESRLAAVDAANHERDAEARETRAVLVRLQTTMEQVSRQLETMNRRLDRDQQQQQHQTQSRTIQ